MRVKKLVRRPKPGEDDAIGGVGEQAHQTQKQLPGHPQQPGDSAAPPTQPQQHFGGAWISPSKEPSNVTGLFAPANYRPIKVGADSPTDSSNPPAAGVVSELELGPTSTMSSAVANHHPPAPASHHTDAPSWRDRADRAVRENVHRKIVEYLKTLKPNAPPKVLEKLPGLAYRMEEALFQLASSEQEYCDQTTLPQRLTLIQQANAKRLLQQQSPVVSPKAKNPSANKSSTLQSRKPLNEEQARVVFSCLQTWRQRLVNMYGAAPWEILPNQILAKVAVYAPSTQQELVVCGMNNEQLDRFGNSLLQEIQKVVTALSVNASAAAQLQVATTNLQRAVSPSGLKRPSPGSGKPSSTKGASAKRTANEASKKRKTTEHPTPIARLPVAPTPFQPQQPLLTPSPLLIRPLDAVTSSAMGASLPALLPSGPLPGATASGSTKKFAPPGQLQQTPFFPRLPVGGGGLEQDNRMHLLAQGAGQVSQQQQQQDAKTIELYEKEVQTLRWLLQESQREKSHLETEIQRLRQQLHAATGKPLDGAA